MQVVIPVGMSPTGVGISQDGAKLRAISDCCGVMIEFNWQESWDYNCSKCKAEIENPETREKSPDSEYEDVSASRAQIAHFVSQWTKWAANDLMVSKKAK